MNTNSKGRFKRAIEAFNTPKADGTEPKSVEMILEKATFEKGQLALFCKSTTPPYINKMIFPDPEDLQILSEGFGLVNSSDLLSEIAAGNDLKIFVKITAGQITHFHLPRGWYDIENNEVITPVYTEFKDTLLGIDYQYDTKIFTLYSSCTNIVVAKKVFASIAKTFSTDSEGLCESLIFESNTFDCNLIYEVETNEPIAICTVGSHVGVNLQNGEPFSF